MQYAQQPPSAVESEVIVLAALLLNAKAYDGVASRLKEDDFYQENHRIIFRTMRECLDRDGDFDAITLGEALKSTEADDPTYLNTLLANGLSVVNIEPHIRLITEASVKRRIIELSSWVAEKAWKPNSGEAKDLLEELETGLDAISASGRLAGSSGFRKFDELVGNVIEQAAERSVASPGDVTRSIKTYFPNLDNVLAGLQRGDLIIVAGRPSMGKTTFAINIAENVAFNSNLPVAVFSMEMGAEQIAQRIICSRARVNAQDIRQGRVTDVQWQNIFNTQGRLASKPLYIDDTPSLTVTEVSNRARRLSSRTGGLGLIVIDYIQLMQGRSHADNRALELSEISRGLKALARELDCPVICLSQLNRGVENRMNKRPMMSDLRESGAIEQDADVIMFVYRDCVYDTEADKNQAEIIIGKQRNGPIGTVRFSFNGGLTRFECGPSDDSFRPI